ncbi:MAG: hypothetical protein PWQ59_848, partial [Thermoanaerobacterium sp.]|nr:hypothetical protein [Thermoanaerobacterium sp.]
ILTLQYNNATSYLKSKHKGRKIKDVAACAMYLIIWYFRYMAIDVISKWWFKEKEVISNYQCALLNFKM